MEGGIVVRLAKRIKNGIKNGLSSSLKEDDNVIKVLVHKHITMIHATYNVLVNRPILQRGINLLAPGYIGACQNS